MTTTEPHPSDLLLQLIVTLLAPMFLCVSGGDPTLAQYAALETVNAYRTRNHADLIAVAQIVAFGLAAIGSLSLSFSDDLPISTALRLRANANACNRSAEQNRHALAASQANDEPSQPNDEPSHPPAEPEAFLSPAAEQMLAAESRARLDPTPRSRPVPANQADTQHQQIWAAAMLRQASEINASLPSLPHGERRAASLQAAVLNDTARELRDGPPASPLEPGPLAALIPAQSGAPQPPR
jgi:hypothetical protein